MKIELHARKCNSIKYRHHYTSSSFRFGIFLLISYQIGYRKKYCSVKFFEQIYLYVYLVSTSVMVVNTSIHSLIKIKLSTSSFILMVHATASGRFEFNQTDQTISFNYMFFCTFFIEFIII